MKQAVIEVQNLSKQYAIYAHPIDRLKQIFFKNRRFYREFTALDGVSFSLQKGEVLGLVGKNGAGKSTLLQLICGTLQASGGQISVRGRVAALLELGAGFNPDFSGRENIFLNAAVLGLSQAEIEAKIDEIIDFSGIGEFIDQPVKSYSSGMFVRLAFSIATSVEPDILIIDEALSVGDGEFARKSFDRIMSLRDRGAAILFCSHSLFQIEAICTQAIWLHRGQVLAQGDPHHIVKTYQAFLDQNDAQVSGGQIQPASGRAHFVAIYLNGREFPKSKTPLPLHSQRSDLNIIACFVADPSLPPPSLAVSLHAADGRLIASAGSWNDQVVLQMDTQGRGAAKIIFPKIALLKGRYTVSAYLLCERGIHIYQSADHIATLDITQDGIEQGLITLKHDWQNDIPADILANLSAQNADEADAFAAQAAQAAQQVQAAPSAASARIRARFAAHMQAQHFDDTRWDQIFELAQNLPLGESVSADKIHTFHEVCQNCPPENYWRRLGFEPNEQGFWQRVRQPRWQPRWCRQADLPQWLQLFAAAFSASPSPELWHWKYAHAPFAGMAVFREDKMVAFYGVTPREVLLFDQPVWSVQITDVMVHPNERGALTRQGAFFVAAASLIEALVPWDKWRRVIEVGVGFPMSRALRLAEKLGVYAQVDQMAECSWSAKKRAPWQYVAVAEPVGDAFSEQDCAQIAQLWEKMRGDFRANVIAVRDADFFEHRFLDHPEKPYQLWWVRRRLGAVVALMVLRDRGDLGLEILDWVGALSDFGEVLTAARHHAARLGLPRVFCWLTQSQVCKIESTQPAIELLDVMVPSNVLTESNQSAHLIGRWWLTGGDTDFR